MSMSRGTTVTLLRVYSGKTVDEATVKAMAEHEARGSMSGLPDNSRDSTARKLPAVIRDSRQGKSENYSCILVGTREEADVLLKTSFTSGFTALKEGLGLEYYSAADSIAVLSPVEARELQQACRYLLSRKYSREMEYVLDNKWIELLANPNGGDIFWDYYYRDDKKALREAIREDGMYTDTHLKRLLTILDAYADYNRYEFGHEDTRAAIAVEVWG